MKTCNCLPRAHGHKVYAMENPTMVVGRWYVKQFTKPPSAYYFTPLAVWGDGVKGIVVPTIRGLLRKAEHRTIYPSSMGGWMEIPEGDIPAKVYHAFSQHFSQQNPLSHKGLLYSAGALALAGAAYAIYAATKSSGAATVTTAPSNAPATGTTDPATNLTVFNRFTDSNLSNLTVPDVSTGAASKQVWVQVFGGNGGNAYTILVGGYSPASSSLWYGQIQGGATQQTAFTAADVSGISADGGQTWVTVPAATV